MVSFLLNGLKLHIDFKNIIVQPFGIFLLNKYCNEYLTYGFIILCHDDYGNHLLQT